MLTEVKIQDLFRISNDEEFEKIALQVFEFQKNQNSVYKNYLKFLGKEDFLPQKISEIPFLPISFFKSHQVICGKQDAKQIFTSSGTGGMQSRHLVSDLEVYRQSYRQGFQYFYGPPSEYHILALLPSYLEREGSSLIYMVEDLIQLSNSEISGFFLNNMEELIQSLHAARKTNRKILLLGVSFALLDLAESHPMDLSDVLIMETGGMKGRREEITREELHGILKNSFQVKQVHSEYGMTELLSQAYSDGNGIFNCPPWMKVIFRNTYDPFELNKNSGGVNVIDLANIYSCSFIETADLGRVHGRGFEILGRLDNSDIRGCNLMIE
ncbi:MAG: acyl transferase [Crocinitomicaceae bacterium]|nr:acyl transferase [Crocinitomicaceae bacterium]